MSLSVTLVSVLEGLNVALPQLLALYRRVRDEAQQLDAAAPGLSDQDLHELLHSESIDTETHAREMLARYKERTDAQG
jgi:hypothetical protein